MDDLAVMSANTRPQSPAGRCAALAIAYAAVGGLAVLAWLAPPPAAASGAEAPSLRMLVALASRI